MRVEGLGLGVWDLGFGAIWGLGLGSGVWGLGSGVWDLGSGVWGLGLGARGLGFGVWDLGCGVWGLGSGVWGLGLGFRMVTSTGGGYGQDVELIREQSSFF